MSQPGLQQSQRQVQGLVLTPQLRQSLRILQVPATELRQVVGEELAANPLLEEVDAPSAPEPAAPPEEADGGAPEELRVGDEDFEALKRMKEDWDDSYYEEVRSQGYTAEDEERRRHQMDSLTGDASLGEHLMGQARLATSDPELLRAFAALAESLDERGFLEEDLSTLALAQGLDYGRLREAHALMLGFDPTGIGARDLRECYLAQLRAEGASPTAATRLVEEAWQPLMERKLDVVARSVSPTSPGWRPCPRGASAATTTGW
jgi:RNA polymerase sigma-54 factor